MPPITGPNGIARPPIEIPRPSLELTQEPQGASFGDVFRRAINDTEDMQEGAQQLIGAFVRGEPVEIHDVMAASEEAQISLELLVEIRNKLTEAYRTVMNVQ